MLKFESFRTHVFGFQVIASIKLIELLLCDRFIFLVGRDFCYSFEFVQVNYCVFLFFYWFFSFLSYFCAYSYGKSNKFFLEHFREECLSFQKNKFSFYDLSGRGLFNCSLVILRKQVTSLWNYLNDGFEAPSTWVRL